MYGDNPPTPFGHFPEELYYSLGELVQFGWKNFGSFVQPNGLFLQPAEEDADQFRTIFVEIFARFDKGKNDQVLGCRPDEESGDIVDEKFDKADRMIGR